MVYLFDNGCVEMNKINLFPLAMDRASAFMRDYQFMCSSRTDSKHFTRKGKLGFVNLIALTLNFVRKSLQLEIDSFFKLIHSDLSISKQAFSKA